MSRHSVGWLLALLLPWSALLGPAHQINHDTAWFYYVARGVLNGGMLYRDYFEANAPMASLSLVPAVLLAKLMPVGPDMAVEIIILAFASLALALSAALLARQQVVGWRLIAVLVTLTAAFVFLPKAMFGQREHILAMFLTPYVLGCAAALSGTRLPAWLGGAIGVAASFAVALKPPFILVPAVLEAAVLARAGPRWVLRGQSVSLAAGVAITSAATMILFPIYCKEVVPWAVALYGGYDQPRTVIENVGWIALGMAIVWFAGGLEAGPVARANRLCLGAAIIASTAAYAAQVKGWPYQLLPAVMLLFILMAGVIATTPLRPATLRAALFSWLPARLMAMLFAGYMAFGATRTVDLHAYGGIARAVAAEPGPFVVLSTAVIPGFPIAVEQDRIWASRMPCLIMLPGLVQAAQRGVTSPWEQPFRDWVNEDMRRYRPRLVFVAPDGPQALPRGFDVLAWLLKDPGFAAIWSQYRQDGVRDRYRMFRLS